MMKKLKILIANDDGIRSEGIARLARAASEFGDDFNPRTPCGVRQRKCTKFSAHFAITDNSIGFPRPECRLLGHFLLIPGACSARERVRTFL